ncbi:MAG: PDZ domain-containing protein [Acidobacteria bacterium]|nr:PDZ domain-containing protein [Acidobacteriota bacterium]
MNNTLCRLMMVLLVTLPAGAGTSQVLWAGQMEAAESPEAVVIAGDEVDLPGVPGRAYLGVDIEDVTSDRVAALKLKEERGVEIKVVDQDAPAGKAGLKVGDVILEFNGQRVESSLTLRRMIHETPPGRTVKLGISRDGQLLTLTATLADRKKLWAKEKEKSNIPKHPREHIAPRAFEMPNVDVLVRTTSSHSGLQVENLTHQLGEFFGVKNGEGVLVRSVEKNSPAEAAGIRAGDVIVKVESERIADTGDWRSAMRRHKSGKVSLGVVRDKREQSVPLTLPETREAMKGKDQSFLMFDMPEFEVPLPEMDFDFDFDFDFDTEELRQELKRIQPEIDRVKREALSQSRAGLQKSKAELNRSRAQAQRALRQAQADLDREMRRLRVELQRELRKKSQESTQ